MKVKRSRFMRILWIPHSRSKQDCISRSTPHSAHPLMRMAVFTLSLTPPPCPQAPGEACSHTSGANRKPGSQARVRWDQLEGLWVREVGPACSTAGRDSAGQQHPAQGQPASEDTYQGTTVKSGVLQLQENSNRINPNFPGKADQLAFSSVMFRTTVIQPWQIFSIPFQLSGKSIKCLWSDFSLWLGTGGLPMLLQGWTQTKLH